MARDPLYFIENRLGTNGAKQEKDRLEKLLGEKLMSAMESVRRFSVFGPPAAPFFSKGHVPPITIEAYEVALTIEFLGLLDRLSEKVAEKNTRIEELQERIGAAQSAYSNPRIKGSKSKAVAAAQALGLRARRRPSHSQLYDEFENWASDEHLKHMEQIARKNGYKMPSKSEEKAMAVEFIAANYGYSVDTVLRYLKRERRRRIAAGIPAPVTIPTIKGYN